MLKNFDKFVNENYYIPGKSERPTQKIIFPVDEYEIGERVQVSVYAENKRAGEVGCICTPTKLSKENEGKVCVAFKDGKEDYFSTTEINRI